MLTWKLGFLAVTVLVTALILLDIRLSKGRHRPLAPRFARSRAKPKLGMEATDEASVAGLLQRNSALAGKTGAAGGAHSWTATGAVAPAPYPEDETYAARYSGTHEERK
jgi:hypothetical protein